VRPLILPLRPLSMTTSPDLRGLKFNTDGLIAAIVQGAPDTPEAGRVLMLAWMDRTALERTLATGQMHYWSRSRAKLWLKGETSGHVQDVVAWHRDCDGDALLFHVRQRGGAACHTGHTSCFFQRLERDGSPAVVEEKRVFDPAQVYQTAAAANSPRAQEVPQQP